MDENKKLRGDLAAAQAEVKSLREQAQKKKPEDNLNKITDISIDISTFHSTDKLDLEKKNILHYFVASSHYYKMRKERTSGLFSFFSGDSNHIDDHNLTITYIQNDDLKDNYEKIKKDKQEKGELYKETLLFHFDINRHPLKRSKVI